MHRGHVVVVLVLGGFARLGLDQHVALQADLVLVLDGHLQEATVLARLLRQVGVEQRLVAFTAAPQHVVLAPQALRGVHRLLHLQRRQRVDLGVRVGGRAAHVAPVAEQVGGAPQQADAGGLLLLAEQVDDAAEVVDALARRGALGRDVAVVEAVERRAHLGEELERHVELGGRGLHRVGDGVPGALERAVVTERVEPVPAERVPVADGEAQVILHALAQHQAILVVPLEAVGIGAAEADGGDVGEVVGHGRSLGRWRRAPGRGRGRAGAAWRGVVMRLAFACRRGAPAPRA